MDHSRGSGAVALQMHNMSQDNIGTTDVWVDDENTSVHSVPVDATRAAIERATSRTSSRRGSLQSSSAARQGGPGGAVGVSGSALAMQGGGRVDRAPSSRSTESKASSSAAKAARPQGDLTYLLEGYEPVRGPIQTQMALVYLLFIAFLGSAEGLEWAPNLRLYLIFVYIVAALLIWELTRMIFFVRPLSVIPMYITLVPLTIMLALSREAHIVVGVLWYASILIIYLQSGSERMEVHVMAFTVAYLAVYFAVMGFMAYFYTCDFPCTETFKGDRLDPSISWREEATFVLCLALMAFSYMMLHMFITNYAKTLIERHMQAQSLYETNVELRKELKKAKTNLTYDLESPLAKVLDILVATRQNQPHDVAETLDFVISVLQSNVHKLFSPDLYDNPVDEDLHTWLDTLLLSDSTARAPPAQPALSASTSANSGSGQLSTPSHGPSAVAAQGTGLRRMYSYDRSNGSMTVGTGADAGGQVVTNVHLNMPTRVHTTEPQIMEFLMGLGEWEFDVFELAQRTNGRPLYYLSKAIFERHFFRQKFNIDEVVLSDWLQKIEQGYLAHNPYHNSTHAADVTQTMHFFLTHDSLYNVLSDEEFFAAVLSCIIHDYEHPGTNNAFHINTASELAIRYNDRSVLENHHCAAAFNLLNSSDACNILNGLDEPTYKVIRELVVNLVLATDMAHHFEYVGKFKNKLQTGLNPEDRDDRRLMLEVGIKCADVSNPAKPRHVCTRWADQIMEEFFRQGDEERRRQLTISMFMDRHTTNIPKCQAGFVDFIVGPMYESWLSFLSGEEELRVGGYIKSNMEYWKGLVDEAEAHLAAKKTSAVDPPGPVT